MVDRSVKMIGIKMKNNMEKVFSDSIPLPDGFSFKAYSGDTDVNGWADIMCDVTFFDSAEKASEYFRNEFLSTDADKLSASEKCFFITDKDGKYVGTCSAWYQGEYPKLHWLGVKSIYQGLGLGKALIQKVMLAFQKNKISPVWLDTQTTSHKAIGLYMLQGFYPLSVSRNEPDKTKSPSSDFAESVSVLNGVMMPKFYQMFIDSAKTE